MELTFKSKPVIKIAGKGKYVYKYNEKVLISVSWEYASFYKYV